MSRFLAWTDQAWEDYLYWQTQDKKTLKRINKLIDDTKRTPFYGIGKPEPLKENLAGFWSRRIDETNRLIYSVDDTNLTIVACRYHY
ncbi:MULTISPECIES: Txe/YoeB family addiction module toxin [Providencia]|uniref:Txe/YoeB family addiction module toxin n=1 Tax=Providencia TaxID=586 RepID=UPI00083885D6|nr:MULTISPECIES: Txe/YoeB family addiction module toxin [Providencia]MBP6123945.1 Txe/YoeB family addiction module toxin [Providencia sp.]NIH24460.1 Txe/YoeB family addiction module toxin [Providencia heimbachae]QCJ71848.1 Txe/YoeB family addiction module toxin [Providencia heimbachae]SQH15849.1 Toxin YoeB [Providencia heimbachae]